MKKEDKFLINRGIMTPEEKRKLLQQSVLCNLIAIVGGIVVLYFCYKIYIHYEETSELVLDDILSLAGGAIGMLGFEFFGLVFDKKEKREI
jgi:hypothetical protein